MNYCIASKRMSKTLATLLVRNALALGMTACGDGFKLNGFTLTVVVGLCF